MKLARLQAKYNRIWTKYRQEYQQFSPELRLLKSIPLAFFKMGPRGDGPIMTVLCVGSGAAKGFHYLLDEVGLEAYACDISPAVRDFHQPYADRFRVAEAHDLPYARQEFDAVVCADVLEHIPPAFVLPTLRELNRVARRWLILQACTLPDRLLAELGDPDRLHLCLESPLWWAHNFVCLGELEVITANPARCSAMIARGQIKEDFLAPTSKPL